MGLATPHQCQHAGHHPRRDLQSDAFTFELWSMVKRTVHSFDAAINCLVEFDHCIRKSLGSLFPPWATGPPDSLQWSQQGFSPLTVSPVGRLINFIRISLALPLNDYHSFEKIIITLNRL